MHACVSSFKLVHQAKSFVIQFRQNPVQPSPSCCDNATLPFLARYPYVHTLGARCWSHYINSRVSLIGISAGGSGEMIDVSLGNPFNHDAQFEKFSSFFPFTPLLDRADLKGFENRNVAEFLPEALAYRSLAWSSVVVVHGMPFC